MERFSTFLQNRCVVVHDSADIVRFSFSSQDSITYLNLNLCEYSSAVNNLFFVSTEEKCRKVFAQSRSLLYNLHLDLAEGREYNLKNREAKCLYYDNSIPHIGELKVCRRLYPGIMSRFVKESLEVTGQKLKILRLLLKPSLLNDEVLYELEPRTANNFIEFFYPDITDSVLFECFFENFNWFDWIGMPFAQPKMLECLLHHARHHVRDFEWPFQELIDACILNNDLSYIKPILKYADTPGSLLEGSEREFIREISIFRPNLTEEVFEIAEYWITPGRIYLMLQILCMFMQNTRSTKIASEALRLIWSSIPDAFFTFIEFKLAVREELADEELRSIYDFYCRSIGEIPSYTEPRSLKHLCRAKVRKVLWENKVWIPEGVSQLGYPKSLQLYLNLE